MFPDNNKELISFWLGKHSQKTAFSFYNLQADQFFLDEEDPVHQQTIWSDTNKATPRMMVIDVEVDRLAEVRKVNTSKMIEKMQKNEGSNFMEGLYGNIDYSGLQGFNMMPNTEEKVKKND